MRTKKLHVYECKVGMIGEKAETREVKEKLSEYFKAEDVSGAKAYFLEMKKKRPDILMEASDITGELRLAMQMISTAEYEEHFTGKNFLVKEKDFKKLTTYFNRINKLVSRAHAGKLTEDDLSYMKEEEVSEQAIFVASCVLLGDRERAEALTEQIQNMTEEHRWKNS